MVTCANLQRALAPLGIKEEECQIIFAKMDRKSKGVITEEDMQETFQEAAKNFPNRSCAKGSSLGACELLKKISDAIRCDQPESQEPEATGQ